MKHVVADIERQRRDGKIWGVLPGLGGHSHQCCRVDASWAPVRRSMPA
jgi:hypothetical protein